ncbi:MAG: EF-hand domain-containing protein [Phycisphaerae bacterium]|nr:EF-hand domain-containing protein [Phycisphaerae bacterium]
MKTKSLPQCATRMVLAVTVLAAPAAVLAEFLPPGGTLYPSPGEPDPIDGTVVASTVAAPLVAETFTGSVTTTVIAGDTSNPLGGLTFAYLVANNPSSANMINTLAVIDFAGFLADASYQSPGGGTPPAYISRSSTGDAVFFEFLTGIGPGSSTALLVLQTNASNYRSTVASAIDGSIGEAASFAPAVAADFDHSGSVDAEDLDVFAACATGPGVPYSPAHLPPDCSLTPDAQDKIAADFDKDGDVDQSDFGLFQQHL